MILLLCSARQRAGERSDQCLNSFPGLNLIDNDKVALSNINRQIIAGEVIKDLTK